MRNVFLVTRETKDIKCDSLAFFLLYIQFFEQIKPLLKRFEYLLEPFSGEVEFNLENSGRNVDIGSGEDELAKII